MRRSGVRLSVRAPALTRENTSRAAMNPSPDLGKARKSPGNRSRWRPDRSSVMRLVASHRASIALLAAALATVVAFEVAGLFEVAAGWAVARAVALTATTLAAGKAIETDGTSRIRWLSAAYVSLAGLTLGVAAFLLADGATQLRTYELVVDASSEAEVLYPSSEPGGPPLRTTNELLVGLHTYRFWCQTALEDGSQWVRVASSRPRWAPAELLRPPNGSADQPLPLCSDVEI